MFLAWYKYSKRFGVLHQVMINSAKRLGDKIGKPVQKTTTAIKLSIVSGLKTFRFTYWQNAKPLPGLLLVVGNQSIAITYLNCKLHFHFREWLITNWDKTKIDFLLGLILLFF